ncbi:MAG TPA: HNH endonuclease, partial [Jatrophihabitantaceae bacterium]
GPCSRQRRPLIQVSVALSTLLGIDDQPGELAGVGPIPAALARRLADDPSGTWRRLITDPRGQLIDYGRSTYRPPAALADHVSARDRTCRFPGCRQPAHTSEIDHRIAWADGGETNHTNLHILCARHHHLKDQTRWQVHRHPDGHTAWTSPTGNHYAAAPPDPYPTDTTIKATTTSPERPPQRESPRQQQQRRPPGPVTQAEPVSVGARKVATDQQHRDTETDPDPPPF